MKVLNLFKKKKCSTCKYYSLLDMNGIPDKEYGFGYCEKKMITSPTENTLCNKWEKLHDSK